MTMVMERRMEVMKKQKGPEIEWVSDPAWLTTFGDLITLLMTFFVLLISFSSIDTEKLKEVIEKVKGEMGILDKQDDMGFSGAFATEKMPSPKSFENLLRSGQSEKATLNYMQGVYDNVSEFLRRTDMNQHVDLYLHNKELVLRIESDKIFKLGLAAFKKKNLLVLDSLFPVLEGVNNDLLISASVKNSFIPSKKFLTKFELSIARSINLCKYFVEKGNIRPERIGVSGNGKFLAVSHDSDIIDSDWDYIEIVLL